MTCNFFDLIIQLRLINSAIKKKNKKAKLLVTSSSSLPENSMRDNAWLSNIVVRFVCNIAQYWDSRNRQFLTNSINKCNYSIKMKFFCISKLHWKIIDHQCYKLLNFNIKLFTCVLSLQWKRMWKADSVYSLDNNLTRLFLGTTFPSLGSCNSSFPCGQMK